MQLKQGTLLQGGKYRIERVLGQGGFGITYLAENTMLEGKVAIKEFFFKECCTRDGETRHVTIPTEDNRELVNRFKQKFIKEARTIFKLNHQNIVRILDIFEENDTAYYVMDYIEGESLGDMVKRRGAIPDMEAVGYIKEVASALSYIHNKSINHLDVKPGNIMKRKADGRILIIDFGVAKQYDTETSEGTTTTPVGISHGYSPMEQYRKNGVQSFSPQSDVYALAATLYKLLTGNTPPESIEIQDEGLPLDALHAHQVSDDIISAIVNAMTTKSHRTQNVMEFLAELDGMSERTVINMDPQPKPAPKTTSKTQPRPVPTPTPKSVIYGIIAAVVIVLGIVLLWGYGGREDPAPAEGNNDHSGTITVNSQMPPYEMKMTDALAIPIDSAKTGSHRGHDWVDLGLPSGTKWATMNVGASSPSDYGSYFAWGETSPKSSYNWSNLKYCIDPTGNKFSKYVTDSKYGNVDGKKELDLSDDAAYVNWGSGWRMPSASQIDELKLNCTYRWTTMNGNSGYKVTSKKNGNSIFLPAAGSRDGSSSNSVGSRGYYWSRSLYTDHDWVAYSLYFISGYFSRNFSDRQCGVCVRPVRVSE